ncbi:MAG: hypothetical protein K0U20_08630 [Proteobacteria bacterium]|nr:hypothetical protein [Pseudomonadota bacterium]
MSSDYKQASIDEYYKIPENVFRDLGETRNLFNTQTTEAEAKNGYKALMLMRLYCPAECEAAVDSTIAEFEFRMSYLGLDFEWTEPEGVMS